MSTTGLNLLNALFTDCDDVVRTSFLLKAAPSESRAYLFYCSGMCEVKQVNDFLKEDLLRYYLHHDITSETDVKDFVPFQLNPLSDSEQEDIVFRLFSGQIILYLEYPEGIYAIDAGSPPKRQPEEPSSELSIRGPKDGFIEEIMVNAALIRKRLRTNRLAFEQYQIGEKTNTRVGLMYLKETIEQELVEDIRRRLMNVRSTGLISAAQLEELLLDTPFNVFPKYEYTSRPDFAANALLHGRFMLLIDGVPSAIIAPTNLTYLLNAAEDANTPTIFVLMTRLYRILGLIIAIYLPGFWIALLTYHQDQIPLTLLSTLVLSRQGVPLPTPLEGIFMLMLFELLKEAGLRLPTAIGQTLSVVGGLIIGQAAISAGMTAPGVLVIMAIAIVATFTLGNQNLVSLVSLLRMGVLIVCAFLGMFGFLISLMGITMALANLRSFGIPYLAPISPPVWRDLFKVLFSLPWRRIDSPPNMIDKKGGSK